jgi:hypothetical protein
MKNGNNSYVVQNICIFVCNRHLIINLRNVFSFILLYFFLNCEDMEQLQILLHWLYSHIKKAWFLLLVKVLGFFNFKWQLVDGCSRNCTLPGRCKIIKTQTAQFRIEFALYPNFFLKTNVPFFKH